MVPAAAEQAGAVMNKTNGTIELYEEFCDSRCNQFNISMEEHFLNGARHET